MADQPTDHIVEAQVEGTGRLLVIHLTEADAERFDAFAESVVGESIDHTAPQLQAGLVAAVLMEHVEDHLAAQRVRERGAADVLQHELKRTGRGES